MQQVNPKPLQGAGKAAAMLCCLLGGIFCAKAFVIDPKLYIGLSSTPAATTDYLWTFVALVFAWMFLRVFVFKRLRPRIGECVLGLLFGVANYFATTLFSFDSWSFVGTTLSIPTVLLKCIGQATVMTTALCYVCHALFSYKPAPLAQAAVSSRPVRVFSEHTALCATLLLLLCWSPYLISFFPGTVIWDMSEMIAQFFGLAEFTTWHSVFTTWVFGGLVWFGRLFGSDNIGVCLFMLMQSGAFAYALGLSIAQVGKLGVSMRWQVALLAFFGLLPIFGAFAQLVGKDTIYTATLLLFLLQTITLARSKDQKPSVRFLVGYGVTALLCCLWRNNGLYVALPTALLTVLFVARGRTRLRIGVPLTAAILCVMLFENVLIPSLPITDNTASGIYSVCFQQTARTLRAHKKTITDEELAEIDQILDAKAIPILYEPWISDPVKHTFKQFGQGADVEKEALARYRKTWLQMLGKYPVTYLQAFMANNSAYYAFTPMYIGATYNQQPGLRHQLFAFEIGGDGQLHPEQIEALAPIRELMTAIADRMRTIPVVAALYAYPLYTWLLVAAALVLLRKKRLRELVCFTPALMSFAVCLVSPVNDYFRYFMPLIVMTPVLCALASDPAQSELSTETR